MSVSAVPRLDARAQCQEPECAAPALALPADTAPALTGWCSSHLRAHYPADWARLALPDLKGKTEPRLWTPPLRELTRATTHGYEVADFADAIGEPFLPWQRWAAIHALELRPDGAYRFRIVLILVARQNGKTSLGRTVSLWKLYVPGVKLIIGSAQTIDSAKEVWQACLDTIEEVPFLNEEFICRKEPATGAFFELTGKRRYRVVASTGRAGRGKSAEHVNADELREQQNFKAFDALMSTTMARGSAQYWGMSNAGDEQSVLLNHLRAKAGVYQDEHGISRMGEPEDDSIGIFEWSAPEGCALDDTDAWAQANPALGHTINALSLRGAMVGPAASFRTENLCLTVESLDSAINLEAWKACADTRGAFAERGTNGVGLCLDVSADGSHVTMVAATETSDGRYTVQVVDSWDSVEAAQRALPDLRVKLRPTATAWWPGGPTGALGTDLKGKGFAPYRKDGKALEITGTRAAEACQEFANLVTARRIIHPDDPLLSQHVAGAKKISATEGGWRFTRRGKGHVDALYAAAGAVHALRNAPKPKARRPILIVGNDDEGD